MVCSDRSTTRAYGGIRNACGLARSSRAQSRRGRAHEGRSFVLRCIAIRATVWWLNRTGPDCLRMTLHPRRCGLRALEARDRPLRTVPAPSGRRRVVLRCHHHRGDSNRVGRSGERSSTMYVVLAGKSRCMSQRPNNRHHREQMSHREDIPPTASPRRSRKRSRVSRDSPTRSRRRARCAPFEQHRDPGRRRTQPRAEPRAGHSAATHRCDCRGAPGWT